MHKQKGEVNRIRGGGNSDVKSTEPVGFLLSFCYFKSTSERAIAYNHTAAVETGRIMPFTNIGNVNSQ